MFLFKDIGISIKQSKTFLSCTSLTFLGIELDSAVMEKRLPKDKLKAWSIFLNCFNRKSLFLSDHWENSVSLQLYTDASNIGFGCYLGNQYFSGVWPKAWESYHITFKELFPIVLAVQLWGKQFLNRCIVFFTDNDAVVHIINRQTFKDKTIIVLVFRLVLNIIFIPSKTYS